MATVFTLSGKASFRSVEKTAQVLPQSPSDAISICEKLTLVIDEDPTTSVRELDRRHIGSAGGAKGKRHLLGILASNISSGVLKLCQSHCECKKRRKQLHIPARSQSTISNSILSTKI